MVLTESQSAINFFNHCEKHNLYRVNHRFKNVSECIEFMNYLSDNGYKNLDVNNEKKLKEYDLKPKTFIRHYIEHLKIDEINILIK